MILSDALASIVPLAATSLEHNLAFFGLGDVGTASNEIDLIVDSPQVLRNNDADLTPVLDANGEYQTTGPNAAFFDEFEFAWVYEVKVNLGSFASPFLKVLPTDSHASPSKTGGSLTDPIETNVLVIPLPASVWSGMLLLGSLCGVRFVKQLRVRAH